MSKDHGQVYCHYLPQLHSSDYWHSMKGHGTEVMLESTSEEKDLGIWTDDKLKFTSHVGHVVANSNQILGIIKRSFVYKDTDIIKKLFTALVKPHLEYANTEWSPKYKKHGTN